ncbi:MAG TPA: PH domain-containing protein [Ktedonobacteraceae bacterium]|jgi:hypothetical protein|nr:PH domain-containing protein [Ktedonobacteraceae bacterium]
MSKAAPQQKPDPWVPRRVHGGFIHLRRRGKGKKRHYEFKGQEPDEVVRMVVRRHKLFLLRPALPAVASLILLFVTFGLHTRYPQIGFAWGFLELVFGLATLVTSVYFLYKDFVLWWLETIIITNKRIITWKGFLSPKRQETGIDKVMQIAIDQENALQILLGYGTVHIYITGGQVVLKDVPNPKKVRDALQDISDKFKANKKPAPKPPPVRDPELAEVLEKLAKGDEVPKLPDPDEKYRHYHSPHRLRGPMRTFGGPLRIKCEVRYSGDEQTVMYVQRSRYLLALRLAIPVLLLLASVIFTLYVPAILTFSAIGFVILLFWIALTIVNYVDDVFIFTSKRIIDIERKLIFFYEVRNEVEYKNIRDIRVIIPNALAFSLDVGTVYVETPGSSPDIKLSFVDHPFYYQDTIYALKGFKEKVDKIKDKNSQKENLHYWFGSVVSVLERKIQNRGVPNLQTLDLWTATERASEFGMKVIPVGEKDGGSHLGPGRIVSQNPLPGTMMYINPDKPEEKPVIEVYLSK